jgi:TIR domain
MHPPFSPPHIFISYARSDGEDFARDLRRRLTEEYCFAVWQDRTKMQVGEAWWQPIVVALTSEIE